MAKKPVTGGITVDIKDIYQEAHSMGFDVKTLRTLLDVYRRVVEM
jgi:uncharacterized protein (UPF0335 family)